MIIYEYRILTESQLNGHEQQSDKWITEREDLTEHNLNRIAMEGWEPHMILPDNDRYSMIFRRPKVS